ncbi:MAG: FadR/GntR family transcriptional regulator [Syntrophomonadaceae bacterium]|nr:FadR/GntR family transcriptional regulator [Syntrophomonadaceae bacterium]
MDFRPIRTKKIYEEIMDQIKWLIVQGRFSPGQRLPAERELAESLGVSRASVREALSALAAMGILEVRPGEGTYVAQVGSSDTIEALALVWSVEKHSLSELMEVRRVLEGEAAALAAQRADEEDLACMRSILEQMQATADRHEQGVDFDLHFHFAIARATHNRVLHRLINTLDSMMHRTFLRDRQQMYASPGVAQRIIGEHQAVLEAIEGRDPAAARAGMLNHLGHVQEGLERQP